MSGDGGATEAVAVAGLGAGAFVAWAVFRMLGTILFVPMIEEFFFRGYLLARFPADDLRLRWLGLGVTSALFALLHGRWVEAFLAGLVFGRVMLRRGRVSDAVQSHMAANATVALWASATGQWDLI